MKKPKTGKKQFSNMKIIPFLLVLLMILVVSAGVSFFFFKDKFAFDSSFIAEIESRQEKKTVEKQENDSGRLYQGGSQEPDISDSATYVQDRQLVTAEDTIRRHIEPYKVRLLDLYMDNEGVIYIDLGEEIKRNFSGGAIDELKLIAGLYKGIKAVVPGCTALKFLIQGSEAESLGGHIDISRPIGDEVAENI